MESDVALLRSQNRQLASLQTAYEREIVLHRQRELTLNKQASGVCVHTAVAKCNLHAANVM